MTEPVTSVRRQSQGHKGKGAGSQAAYDGTYTGENFVKTTIVAATDGPIVTAVAGKRIRVLSYTVGRTTGAGITFVFNSKGAGAGTAISHTLSLQGSANVSESDNNGLFQTAIGEGLTGTNGSIITAQVRVTYILVE